MSATLSVIVRTLGRPSLASALSSVVAQGRDDVELIVVDARGDLAKPAHPGLPMRWVSEGHALHRSVAAQAGLDAVHTRWAMFLDDDDVLLPGHLDKLVKTLGHHGSAVLAHTGVELIGSGAHASRQGQFDVAFEPWELLLGNRMPIHAALFDAELARRHGARFDAALDVYEDWDFWLQLRQLGEFVHVPGVSAQYLVGDDSSPAHHTAHGDDAYWRVWRKWWPRAPAAWWARVFRAGADAAAAGHRLHAAHAELQLRLAEVEALHGQLRRAGEEANQLHGVLQERMQIVEQLRLALDGMQQQWLAEQQARTHIQQRLDATQASLRSTEEALSATATQLTGTEQKLAHAADQLVQTAQMLAAAQLQRQRSADEVLAMQRSSSWRVTEPLRVLATQGRRMRAWAGRFKREVFSQQALLRGAEFRQYQAWINGTETSDQAARALARSETTPELARAAASMCFSVVVPVFNPRLDVLGAALNSVLAQTHNNWQLCIADDASTIPDVISCLDSWAAKDPRVQLVKRPRNGHIAACTNSALELARGDWVVFLDQDDTLAPHALAELAAAVATHPDISLVYSDEDKLDASGERFEPHFKPPFSIELLRGQNFVNHLTALRRSELQALGGMREGFDGAQDHDLTLRVAERLGADQVLHLPQVLYHWRVGVGSTASAGGHKAYALDASARAVAQHLSRCESGPQVEALPGLPWLRVRYPVPATQRDVAITGLASGAARQLALQPPSGLCRLNAGDDVTSPWILVLGARLKPRSPSWLEEMVALLARSGVGVVGGVIFENDVLVQGAIAVAEDGQPRTLCLGVRADDAGPFGAARLVRSCDAVSPDAMLMRRELWPVWQAAIGSTANQRALAFAESTRAAGWRILWTPFAAFEDAAAGEP